MYRRHWITQSAVTVLAALSATVGLAFPSQVEAREAIVAVMTLIWVWGP